MTHISSLVRKRLRAGKVEARQSANVRSLKAGHGNDRVWKAWKAMKPASHPFHTLWKSLRIPTFPRPRRRVCYLEAKTRTSKTKSKSAQGAVTNVPGPKRNACPGTLIRQEGLVSISRDRADLFWGRCGCPRWDGESPRQGRSFLPVLAGSWGRELSFPILILQVFRALAG
jgi:hypothetical protein